MRTYASNYWQTLSKLRLPAAAPFIFNALKINSTLALIGAIVAEFFGTPIVGMGFRIATEVGRLNADMVWAEVAVAADIRDKVDHGQPLGKDDAVRWQKMLFEKGWIAPNWPV